MDTSGLILANGEARTSAAASPVPPLATSILSFNPTVDGLYGGKRADKPAVRLSICSRRTMNQSEFVCRGASSSSDDDPTEMVATLRRRAVAAAPAVDTSGLVLADGEAAAASHAPPLAASTLSFNPTVDELYGGERADTVAVSKALRNHAAGHVEDAAVPSAVFELQYNAFHAHGRAEAPDGRAFGAGDVPGALVQLFCIWVCNLQVGGCR